MAKLVGFCAVVLVSLPILYLAAQPPNVTPQKDPAAAGQPPANDPAPPPIMKKGLPDPVPPVKQDGLADEDPIGRTVRLTFTIKNDDGEESFPVVCASRTFLIEHDVSEDDGGHQLKLAGRLKTVDQKDRVFVQFDLQHYHSNNNNGLDATFKLRGSAIATLGKKLSLGNVGDQQISLTVTPVE